MTYTYFSALLNQHFSVAENPGAALQLFEATRETASIAGHEAFSLMFRGALPVMGQGTYTLSTADSGPLALFLVPVARVGDAAHYQAVFN